LHSEFCTPKLSELLPIELKKFAENSALGIGLSLMDDFAHGDLQLNTSVSVLSGPKSFADKRLAFNFHRQNQFYKNRDPFIIPPLDWSSVTLELGPGHVPIYKFEHNTRGVIWPKTESTTLTIDNIGFGLLWNVLSEEFGWTRVPGFGCANDLFKSPHFSASSENDLGSMFYGNGNDLRHYVKLHGLLGNHDKLEEKETLFCLALAVDNEGNRKTTLTIYETSLYQKTIEKKQKAFVSNECSFGYGCFCLDGPCRTGDGSSELLKCNCMSIG
jgi:hypothetical protein